MTSTQLIILLVMTNMIFSFAPMFGYPTRGKKKGHNVCNSVTTGYVKVFHLKSLLNYSDIYIEQMLLQND